MELCRHNNLLSGRNLSGPSEEMAELVKRLPADKVDVQSQIRDLAAIGGPEIKQDPSSFKSFC